MLNNKKFNIILSVLIAISLWAYVVGETNPVDKEVFREVPIEFTNTEAVEQNGWAVLDVSTTSVNMTVSGPRKDVKKVGRRDVSAYVDLAEVSKGTNEVKINFRVPDNVELEEKSVSKVTVIIENSETRDVRVEPAYKGSFEENQEPSVIEQSIESVSVTGAETNVEKIEKVKAVVEEGEVKDDPKKIRCRLVPVDKLGNEVKNITLSSYYADLTVELVETKTVRLDVPYEDKTAEVTEKEVIVPQTITIKGNKSAIDDILTISTEKVDISDIGEDTEIELVPVLPAGVSVSDKSEELIMKVKVSEPETKTFTFDENDVEIHGLDDELDAEINETEIKVTIRGSKSVIEKIVSDDFRLYIDAEDLDEGKHSGDLYVICEKECGEITFTPEKVKFTIDRR